MSLTVTHPVSAAPTSHTPPPWKVGTTEMGNLAVMPEASGQLLPDGFTFSPVPICRVAEGVGRSPEEAAANARLLAAAPDLLEALELLAAAAAASDSPGRSAILGMRLEESRVAIAKARGQ